MGIYGHRFYFRDGLPKVRAIKEKFFEITGLKLGFTADVYMKELIPESDDIAFYLHRSQEERDYIFSPEFEGDKVEAQRDLHRVDTPYFSCDGFSEISLGEHISAGGKSFHIECGIRQKSMYFFFALIKTMLELGGHTYRYSTYDHEADPDVEEKLEPYLPHERFWKRIKKWDEMCAVERAAFIGKYS